MVSVTRKFIKRVLCLSYKIICLRELAVIRSDERCNMVTYICEVPEF